MRGMTISELHRKSGRESWLFDETAYYDALRRLMSRGRSPAKNPFVMALLHILRDMNYFAEARGEAEEAVRAAAVRLLAKVESATGFSLDVGFARWGG